MREARREADVVLRTLPQELRAAPVQGEPVPSMAEPTCLRWMCDAAVRALIALPAGTPSLRLLADYGVSSPGSTANSMIAAARLMPTMKLIAVV